MDMLLLEAVAELVQLVDLLLEIHQALAVQVAHLQLQAHPYIMRVAVVVQT